MNNLLKLALVLISLQFLFLIILLQVTKGTNKIVPSDVTSVNIPPKQLPSDNYTVKPEELPKNLKELIIL